MRPCGPRPALPAATSARLQSDTTAITRATNPKAEATRLYDNARVAPWFTPVIDTLRTMAGTGENCMWCSSSESSQVEHYRPKSVYPELALSWDNYLWACSVCNSVYKGNRFPTGAEQLLDPAAESIWDYFFIDDTGLLTPHFDPATQQPHRRAVSTRDLIRLNREVVHARRRSRMHELRQQVEDTLLLAQQGHLTRVEVQERWDEWRHAALQPDVASYFLDGPGRGESPYADLWNWLYP